MNPRSFQWMPPLLVAVGLAVAGNAVAAAVVSKWVFPGPDGKLEYKMTPTGDYIMDFSTPGYGWGFQPAHGAARKNGQTFPRGG